MATRERIEESSVRDGTLADRARRGNGAAFAALVARHGDAVYTIVRNLCATSADCEEVVHQAFLGAWHELGSLPSGASFTTWLYGITTKIALAQRRRDGARSSPAMLLPESDGAGPLVPRNHGWPELDGRTSEHPEVTGLLREALGCIDDRTRAAFVLRDVLELPAEQAAVILETSPQAIHHGAHRARLFLHGLVDHLASA